MQCDRCVGSQLQIVNLPNRACNVLANLIRRTGPIININHLAYLLSVSLLENHFRTLGNHQSNEVRLLVCSLSLTLKTTSCCFLFLVISEFIHIFFILHELFMKFLDALYLYKSPLPSLTPLSHSLAYHNNMRLTTGHSNERREKVIDRQRSLRL